jgi:hypothetical protein
MDLTEGSETSAKHNLTPGKYPKHINNSHKTNYEYKRITLSAITYGAAEEAVRKWRREMDYITKDSSNKTIFTDSSGENRGEDSLNP